MIAYEVIRQTARESPSGCSVDEDCAVVPIEQPCLTGCPVAAPSADQAMFLEWMADYVAEVCERNMCSLHAQCGGGTPVARCDSGTCEIR